MSSRALIIFPGALGDLICLVPTIEALARRHSGAAIELMARNELAEFAVGRLGIARAHSIDRREVAMLFRESPGHEDEPARRFFGAFERIYCFFSADDPLFRRALTAASAPDGVTFHPFRPRGEGHVAAAYLKDATGDDLGEISISLLPSDIEDASRALEEIAETKEFVAIFPGSGSTTKNWPIEKFCALADQLNEESRTVFILGPAEDSLDMVLRASGRPVIKNQPLGVVAAIARMAAAFVGNDPGVAHLAAATATSGVVLFGPTAPARWRPLGRITIIHREPMETIEVAEVLSALRAAAL